MPAPFRRLLVWRLRHLASASFRLTTRRWQAVALLLLMASPRMMPLAEQLRLLAAPVMVLVRPGAAATALGAWCGIVALALAWSRIAPGLLDGGAAWHHLRTLPLSRRLMTRVDLTVLVVADLPLMLPFVAAAATLLRQPPAERASRLVAVVAVVTLAAVLPLAQWLFAERSRGLPTLLAGSAVGIALTAAGASPWCLVVCATAAGATAVGATAAGAMTVGAMTRNAMTRSAIAVRVPALHRVGRWRSAAPRRSRLRPAGGTRAQLVRIQLRGLIAMSDTGRRLGWLFWALLPTWLAWSLPRLGLRADVLPIALLVALPPAIFAFSDAAFDLRRLHAPMRELHASQGWRAAHIAFTGWAVLSVLGGQALLPAAVALSSSVGAGRGWWLLPAGLAAQAACVALNQRGDEGVFLPKLAVTCLAAGGLVALLVD